jgi:hypothetical protein
VIPLTRKVDETLKPRFSSYTGGEWMTIAGYRSISRIMRIPSQPLREHTSRLHRLGGSK